MFDYIFDKYHEEIFIYCKSALNGDIQGAEDCTQEVFLTFFNKMDKITVNADIKSWLYRTASYKVKNYQRSNRHNKQQISLENVSEDIFISNENVETEYEIKEKLSKLSENDKQLLTEYYSNQHPEKRLNITLNALRQRINEIKNKLK